MTTHNQPPVQDCPILEAWPEFHELSETERSNVLEARARAYGGQGYLPSRHALEQDHERSR
jgi:hypothetical protein